MQQLPAPVLRHLPENRELFREQEDGSEMYIVRRGSIRLLLGQREIETVQPGGILGEMALLQGEVRSATAIAGTDCVLQTVDRETFTQMVYFTPFFGLIVLRTLARRLRSMGLHVRAGTRFARVTLGGDISGPMLQAASYTDRVPKGTLLLRQDEPGPYMYAVRRGMVELKIRGVTVERVGPGGILGELSVLDQEPRAASAVAVEESEVLVFDRIRFEYLLALDPDFALRLMQLLARRLRATNQAVG